MGNDNNSGRTWGTRLATVNGAEDKPVVAGDTVWVAPGVYRELLTIDVSGAAGSPITYIGDVTGEHTDGVGGPVRITGSDNDTTATRARCVFSGFGGNRHYRTFRGFFFDMATGALLRFINSTDLIVEDCIFGDTENHQILLAGTALNRHTIRRCLFYPTYSMASISLTNGVTVDDQDIVIENCLFIGSSFYGVLDERVGGVIVRNCGVYGQIWGIRIGIALAVGQTLTVNNCILAQCGDALRSAVLGHLVENYNALWDNGTDRVNVNVGGNSNAYPPLRDPLLLQSGDDQLSGFRLPWWFGSLSRWSQVRQIIGTGEPDEDLFGLRRPYTHGGPVASLCSWGPVQWTDFRRDTLRSHDGSLSARVREKQRTHMFVPGVSTTSHTISAWAWRTAGYTGHRNPEMVIKQPGQPDRRIVAGGAAGAWVQVSDTFTPAAVPPWLTVELWNQCAFTTTTTVSTTSTSTLSTTSTSTVTVSTLTTTTTTLPCDVWWDDIQVS